VIACPSCGADWPGFNTWEPCEGCGLTRDDVEAAAAFLADMIDERSTEREERTDALA
jgi:hypothetical protein